MNRTGHSGWSRRQSLAVVVLASMAPICGMAAESEPNDAISTATPAPFSLFFDGLVTEVFIGNGVDSDLDVDMYAVEVPPDWPLPVSFSAMAASDSSVDLMLRLFDANGVELANIDDGGNPFQPDLPSLTTYFFSPGMYYLGVSSAHNPLYDPNRSGSGRFGAGGAYNLFISGNVAALAQDNFEPNDSTVTATSMGQGSFAVSGRLIGDGAHGPLDVDIYRISPFLPARIDIAVTPTDFTFDPVVRVRNCAEPLTTPTQMDRCTLGAADDEPTGDTAARLSTALFDGGDVYIMVSGSGNRGFDPAEPGSGEYGSVGVYDLAVTVTPLSSASADEPNDSLLTASQTPILIEGRPDSFTIDAFLGDGPYSTLRGDRDFYELRSVESSTLFIEVQAGSIGSSFVPVLAAYDREGHMLAYMDSSAAGGDALLTLPAACATGANSSLLVMVMGTQQRLPNDVFDPLPVSQGFVAEPVVTDGPGSIGPYRLRVTKVDSATGCAVEPNDTIATATPTGLVDEGTYICRDAFWGDSQCPDPQEDLDIWTFSITQTPVEVRVESWDCDLSDPIDLTLFNAAGDEIAFVVGYSESSGYYTDIVLTANLTAPGDYYVVAGARYAVLDIYTPCSCYCWSAETSYDIAITLTPGRQGLATLTAEPGNSPPPSPSLFATRLDAADPRIDVYEADTGAIVAEIAPPEPQLGGLGGMASNGTHLFYLGAGRFPMFYILDPLTGEVLNQYVMWVGSGYYTGAAAFGNNLYLLDHRRRQIHVVNLYNRSHHGSLPLGVMHGITIGGGLASLYAPNRLYVADAFNTRSIYEIYPENGALTKTLPPGVNRATALAAIESELFVADFRSTTVEVRNRDGESIDSFAIEAPIGVAGSAPMPATYGDMGADGDIDLADAMLFQNCFGEGGLQSPFCSVAGDFNDDGVIQYDDAAMFFPLLSGP